MNKKTLIKIVVLTDFFIILDQATKFLAQNNLKEPFFITSFFSFYYSENHGIAWSIPVPKYIILILTTIFLLLIPLYLYNKVKNNSVLSQVVIAMFCAGAISNLIDRLFFGFVRDFISIGTFPVFNFADAFICTSVFLIIVFYDRITGYN